MDLSAACLVSASSRDNVQLDRSQVSLALFPTAHMIQCLGYCFGLIFFSRDGGRHPHSLSLFWPFVILRRGLIRPLPHPTTPVLLLVKFAALHPHSHNGWYALLMTKLPHSVFLPSGRFRGRKPVSCSSISQWIICSMLVNGVPPFLCSSISLYFFSYGGIWLTVPHTGSFSLSSLIVLSPKPHWNGILVPACSSP